MKNLSSYFVMLAVLIAISIVILNVYERTMLNASDSPESSSLDYQSTTLETQSKCRINVQPDTQSSLQAYRPSLNVLDIYQRHIEAAWAECPNSQLVVSLVYNYCLFAPNSISEIEDAKREGIDLVVLKMYEMRFRDCQPLRDQYPNAGFDQKRQALRNWRNAAQKNGQPLAMLGHVETREERAELLKNALRENYEDRFLRSEVYRQTAVLFIGYPGFKDRTVFEAWFHLYCVYRDDCNHVDRKLSDEEAAVVRRIEDALAKGRIEDLEF